MCALQLSLTAITSHIERFLLERSLRVESPTRFWYGRPLPRMTTTLVRQCAYSRLGCALEAPCSAASVMRELIPRLS